jgi:hypothetical protein
MTDTALGYSVGLIVSGIALIGANIEEYQIRHKKVLELHSEILMMQPFISALTQSPEDSGVHNRLQRLLVLLEEIRIWLEGFGRKSAVAQFFLALSHKKDIHIFYSRIQELKRELGFEMKVGNFKAQQQLNQQISELVSGIENAAQITGSVTTSEQIKNLIELQQKLCDLKLENQMTYITNMDQRLNILFKEYESEMDVLRDEMQKVKESVTELQHKVAALENRGTTETNKLSAFARFLVNELPLVGEKSPELLTKLWSQHPENPECIARIERIRMQTVRSQNYTLELQKTESEKQETQYVDKQKEEEEEEDEEKVNKYNSSDDSPYWEKKCEKVFQDVPRLQGVFGDYETFIKVQRGNKGRSFKKITQMFDFEAEQLVTNPKLPDEVRNIWNHTPRIQRMCHNQIFTFLNSMNWKQLRDTHTPEYLEASNHEHHYYEKMLMIIYNQSAGIQQEFGSLHEFLFRDNLTFPALYKKYFGRWEKDTEYYDKCMILWDTVPRLKYNWNGCVTGFLSYSSGDLKYLYYTFHPEYVQLQTMPDLRERLDEIWRACGRVRHIYKNNHSRWMWADYNWGDKYEKYKQDLCELRNIPDLEQKVENLYFESAAIQNQFGYSLNAFLYQENKTFGQILREFGNK